MLRVNKQHKAEMRDVLRELVMDGFLQKNGKSYELSHKAVLHTGKIVLDKEMEFAVEVKTEIGLERIRIRKKNLQTAMIDDIVEISIIEYARKNIKEAIVENIVKRSKHRIVGKLEYAGGNEEYAFVIPDDKKFRKDIYIPLKNLKSAENGDKVI